MEQIRKQKQTRFGLAVRFVALLAIMVGCFYFAVDPRWSSVTQQIAGGVVLPIAIILTSCFARRVLRDGDPNATDSRN